MAPSSFGEAYCKYRLEDMVAGITAGNRHDETDWGGLVGKEIW